MAQQFRVLVVDDSAFVRRLVTDMLEGDPELTVVGTARDGLDALEQVERLRPDVTTLDVEMPRLDGLGALRRIMDSAPHPVVMVSSLTRSGADTTIRALALGAVDFVAKPSGSVSLDLIRLREELVTKVRAAARVPPGLLRAVPAPQPQPPLTSRAPEGQWSGSGHGMVPPAGGPLSRLVVVAASTGGPGALHRLLGALPAGLRAGLLIVQHMPAGFTRSLAAHLDVAGPLTVREAVGGDRPADGLALVAPGGHHLAMAPNGSLRLSDRPPRHGVRPAADETLESVPAALAGRCVVIVLTGMGMDGARGAWHLKERGAAVWVQDAASCVVYGMPRAVAELGVAERTGTPEQLAAWIGQFCGHEGSG